MAYRLLRRDTTGPWISVNHSASSGSGVKKDCVVRSGLASAVARTEDSQRLRRLPRPGAVRIVEETNKPIAQVARDLGVNEGTLDNWGGSFT